MPNGKSSLADIQRRLTRFVGSGAANNSVESSVDHELTRMIVTSPDSATSSERLGVYAEGWYLRLEESLAEDFPVLREKLGDDWHPRLRAYLQKFPSSSYTIAHVSNSLPKYLKETGAAAWQVELASIELDLCLSSYAADSRLFDLQSLATLEPEKAERLKLVLQPSAFLHELNFNTLKMIGENANLVSQPSFALVYRDADWDSAYESIPKAEFEFLKLLSRPISLGELADQCGETEWIQWLSKWSKLGVVGPAS